jgi:PAS domain S-box-containing protein
MSDSSFDKSIVDFLDINPLPVWCFDQHTNKILYANHSAIQQYGYTLEQYLSLNILHLLNLSDLPSAENARVNTTIKNSRSEEMEIQCCFRRIVKAGHSQNFVFSDSETISANKRKSCKRTEELHPNGYEGVTDTSNADTRKSERAFSFKSKQIESILNSITDGFFAVDRQWNFILTNSVFEKGNNREKHQLIGKNLWELFPQLASTFLASFYKEVMLSNKAAHTTYDSTANKNVTYEISAYPNPEGLLVYFRDITIRKKSEEEVKRLAIIANHTSNAVILTNAEGRTTWVNKGFEQLMGFDLNEMIGTKPGALLQGADTDSNTVSRIREALVNKESIRVEILNYTKQKKPVWLDLEIIPLKDDSGEVNGFMAIEIDITQLKNAIAEMLKSQEQLQTIVNNIPMDVFIKDLKGNYTFVNKSYENHFLKRYKSALNFTDHDIFKPHEAARFVTEDANVISSKQTLEIEQDVNDEGTIDTYYTVKFPLCNSNGDVYALGGVSLRITDRKQIETKLRESEARYRSIVDDQLEMICRYKKGGIISFVNRAFQETFGIPASGLIGKNYNDIIVADEKPDFHAHIDGLFEGEMLLAPTQRKVMVAGKFRWQEWYAVPLKDENGNVYEVQSIGHDITYRKSLEAEQARLEKIVRESHNEIFVFNSKTLALEFGNASALKNLGYEQREFQQLKVSDLFTFPDEMALHALLNGLKNSETDRLQLQLKFRRKDSSPYHVDVLIQILESEKSCVAIASDITSKILTEQKLLDTILEKEALIKEIHHRVKNNLQLISSILYLKMLSLEQSEIRGFLENIRQKIRSISLIHERLLQSEHMDKVEISDYLGKLITDIQITYFREDLALEIQADIAKNIMSLDTAIMCGLIVNEIITNAMKHAFKGRSSGLIQVLLHAHENPQHFTLSIGDNGVTLPAHISPGAGKSFGMQLIDVFVKQLGGKLEIIRKDGTTFLISIG